MKKIWFITASLVVLGAAAPAFAADLAARRYTKAPPMMMAAYDWSGFYIGLNGGGATSHNCWTFGGASEGCHDATGGTVGGQIGYRWQQGPVVFGVEAQGNWADFKGDNASLLFATRNQTKIDAFGLFTGQVGYAFNNVPWYVKGGGAVAADRYVGFVTGTNFLVDTARETRWGGAVGTGVEIGIAPSWSVGLEYDHLFMGNRNINFQSAGIAGTTRIDRITQDVDMGTVRVNYRWGGPVISKY
jgi:outer membrane immunogenic protein